MKKIEEIRHHYKNNELSFSDLHVNPIIQADKWLNEAIENKELDANAMALATSSPDGKPSVRYVLLKEIIDTGFIFYTNYESRKGAELDNNPNASFAFYWPKCERQLRVEGQIELLGKKESDKYYNSRPIESRIGAWASPQSKPIPSREYMMNLKEEYHKKYKHFRPTRPEFWGGYIIKPHTIEFWQGQPNRLHDRIEYKLKNKVWTKERLAP